MSQSIRSFSVTKPRLACVSPLPPAQSGISDDVVRLLKALTAHYDIEVVVQQDMVSDAWILEHCPIRTVDWFLQHHLQFDRVLYHFGNSQFHDYMLHLLQRVPGVVVLQDFYLSALQSHHLQGIDQRPWRRMLHANHGYPALLADQLPSDRNHVIWQYPCNLEVLQHAKGIVSYSEFSLRLARQWHGPHSTRNWRVIPFLREPKVVQNLDCNQARVDLGLPPEGFVICTFGLIGEHQLSLELLEAFVSSSLSQDPHCMLVFVGANDNSPYGKTLLQRILQSGLGQRIRITGRTDVQRHQKYLLAADIGVQLRACSRGELSTAVLDCMSHGLPTIVNANGIMADLDPATVWMLPDPFFEHELTFALETLRQQPKKRHQMGQAARQFLIAHHAPEHCAQQYKKAIEYFHRPTLDSLLQGLSLRNLNADECHASSSVRSQHFPPHPRHRQLLVDISELVRHDARTGIQRVTRAILNEWLRYELRGWRIEPVWANDAKTGYCYARKYTSQLLGLKEDWARDEPVEAWAGDYFFGLDLQPKTVPAQRETFRQWRIRGVSVGFLVYDLLPLQHPQFFLPDAAQDFTPWLETVAECDAAFCISRSTRNVLQDWLRQQPTGRQPALHWFHLGADVERSIPTQGLPENADHLLNQLRQTPGFLMVGTLEPRKGHVQVLDAFEHLWQSGHKLQLVIVGKQGWMVDELAHRLANHPENGCQLHWLDAVSDEYLSRLYQSSSALIAASYGEGYGLPLIEAARHGCAILARDIPVFREVAEGHAHYFAGETGFGLSQAILEWLVLKTKGREPSSRNMYTLSWRESAMTLLKLVCMDDVHYL